MTAGPRHYFVVVENHRIVVPGSVVVADAARLRPTPWRILNRFLRNSCGRPVWPGRSMSPDA